MKVSSFSYLVLFSVGLAGLPASATLLYDNGGPDLEGAYFSDFNDLGMQCADNFFGVTGSTASATITGVQWFGLYYGNTPPPEDVFIISFYALEAGCRPAISSFRNVYAGAANRTDTGLDFISGSGTPYDVYSYSANIGSLYLNLCGHYFISITDNEPGSSEDDDWFWCTSALDQGDMWYRYGYDMWSHWNSELAFSLTGEYTHQSTVPEPATILLLTMGSAGLAVRRYRCARRRGSSCHTDPA